MEVKNFRSRPEVSQAPPILPYLDQPELLADIFEEKIKDTLKGIAAVESYYLRNWFYRFYRPLIRRLPSSQIDRIFWTHANQLVNKPNRLFLVLWLEVDVDQKDFLLKIETLLKERLKTLADHVYLSSTQHMTFEEGLTIILKS